MKYVKYTGFFYLISLETNALTLQWRDSSVEDTMHGGDRRPVKVCASWPGLWEWDSDASGGMQRPCLSLSEGDKVSLWPCSDGCYIVGDVLCRSAEVP